MESIGEILKRERTDRGLSLQDVHDSTKITVQNLAALEENRFEYFPNKVYARAFLRDYSNFLALDSESLLSRYEEDWNSARKVEVVEPAKAVPVWKPIGYTFLAIIVLCCLGAAAYFGWAHYEKTSKLPRPAVNLTEAKQQNDQVAQLPKVKPVIPPKENTKTTAVKKSESAAPVMPDKLTLNVAALADVWVRITSDGQKTYEGILTKGQAKSFEAKKIISIRSGKAGGVQLKLNGQTQPPMGPLGAPGEKTYKMPASGNAPASTGNAAPVGGAIR